MHQHVSMLPGAAAVPHAGVAPQPPSGSLWGYSVCQSDCACMQDQVDAAEASNDAQLVRALQSMQDTLPEGLQVSVVISGCNDTAKRMVSHSSSCHRCKPPASCASS